MNMKNIETAITSTTSQWLTNKSNTKWISVNNNTFDQKSIDNIGCIKCGKHTHNTSNRYPLLSLHSNSHISVDNNITKKPPRPPPTRPLPPLHAPVYLTNPLIINLAISEYDCKELCTLSECMYDIGKMEQLWSSKFKYNQQNMLNNQNYPYITADKIWDLLLDARVKINDDKSIDGMILMYSGHGKADTILASDYDGHGSGEILINDIQHYFGDNEVRPSFLSCPKLLMMDMCRGDIMVETVKYKFKSKSKGISSKSDIGIDKCKGRGKSVKLHPLQDYAILYSNANGYSSNNGYDGGYLISAITKILSNRHYVKTKGISSLQRLIRRELIDLTQSKQCMEFSSLLTNDVYLGIN